MTYRYNRKMWTSKVDGNPLSIYRRLNELLFETTGLRRLSSIRMGGAEILIYAVAAAPAVLIFGSLLVARAWRRSKRHRHERLARNELIRQLGFRPAGPRRLAGPLDERRVNVRFGVTDEAGTSEATRSSVVRSLALRPRRDPDEMGAPNRVSSATIVVEAPAPLPRTELLVEMQPTVVLRGRHDWVATLLELPFRNWLGEGERVHWRDNELRVTTCQHRKPAGFVALVRRTVRVAHEMAEIGTSGVERVLVDEALSGPKPEYRLRALRLLLEFYPTPLTRSALFRMTMDRDPAIQLSAARALGAEGWEKMRSLAENRHKPTSIRVAAIDGIAAIRRPDLEGVLERLLYDQDVGVAVVALRRLGGLDRERALPKVFARAYTPDAPIQLVLESIRFFERLGIGRTAGALAQLLMHPAPRIQSAVIDVVGRQGDLTWLQALTELKQRPRIPVPLRISIKTAVSLIRSRHQATAGRLSISATAPAGGEGGLSEPIVGSLAMTADPSEEVAVPQVDTTDKEGPGWPP